MIYILYWYLTFSYINVILFLFKMYRTNTDNITEEPGIVITVFLSSPLSVLIFIYFTLLE